ncbi:MAG: hypothetical protein AABX73_00610 [Nanoarchaeota archaeon]
MDLLRKIKLLFIKEKEKKDETIKEIVQIEELPSKLESKINELMASKKQLKENISKRVSFFEIEINKQITSLKNIDISQRKEYDRIKIIVEENLALYILHLKRTIDNIKEAEKEEVEEYINQLSRILNEFNRVSSMPFEKATILIGDELNSTRAIIRSFIQDFSKIVEENKLIFEKSRLCVALNSLLSESKQLASLHTEMENELSEMNALLKNARIKQGALKKRLLEIKEEEDFKKDNEEKIDYKNKVDSLERKIHDIKGELDLKSLLKKFHHDKKIDSLIRGYMSNFKNALEEDKELRIAGIIENNNKKHLDRLKEIQKTIISLFPPSPTKIDKEIAVLEERIKEGSTRVLELEEDIKNEIKRKEKLSMKLQKINSDLIEKSKRLCQDAL